MNVIRFNETGKKGNRDLFIRLTEWEALRLIESLSAQMRQNSPNTSRAEFRTDEQRYFSIAVHRTTECSDTLPPTPKEDE